MGTTDITQSQFFECSKRQTAAYDESDLIDSCNDHQDDIAATEQGGVAAWKTCAPAGTVAAGQVAASPSARAEHGGVDSGRSANGSVMPWARSDVRAGCSQRPLGNADRRDSARRRYNASTLSWYSARPHPCFPSSFLPPPPPGKMRSAPASSL